MGTAEKVYVLILNWNNWNDTVACLESVFQNSHEDYQVVVIDNASTDGSEGKIIEWAEGRHRVESGFFAFDPGNKPIPHIRYDRETAERGGLPEKERSLRASLNPSIPHPLVLIQTGGNRGYAGGNNIGIRYALGKGDCGYIWILNNDTVIEKNALVEMLRCAESEKNAGMVGSKLLLSSQARRPSDGGRG